jgi:hypothetical protein
MLFGQLIRPGASPEDILSLDIDSLRAVAQIEMVKKGYSPA